MRIVLLHMNTTLHWLWIQYISTSHLHISVSINHCATMGLCIPDVHDRTSFTGKFTASTSIRKATQKCNLDNIHWLARLHYKNELDLSAHRNTEALTDSSAQIFIVFIIHSRQSFVKYLFLSNCDFANDITQADSLLSLPLISNEAW